MSKANKNPALRAEATAPAPEQTTEKADVLSEVTHKAEKSRPSAFFEVYDRNCSPAIPRRVHDIYVDGRLTSFTFEINKAVDLDEKIALIFLKDEAFEVIDPATGKRLLPLPKVEKTASGAPILSPLQTVARWDELTDEALYARCQQIAGGQSLEKSDRLGMVSFLANANGADVAEDDGDEMSGAALDQLFRQ